MYMNYTGRECNKFVKRFLAYDTHICDLYQTVRKIFQTMVPLLRL